MDPGPRSSTPAAALVVAALATIALGTRTPPRRPPVEPPPSGRHREVVATASSPIDVNRATAEELESLPRVGPALAARMVAYRDAHGPFRSIADLDPIPGVGTSMLTRLAPIVTFGSAVQNRSNNHPTRNDAPTEMRPGITSVRNP